MAQRGLRRRLMQTRQTAMSDYRIQGATGEWEVVIGLEVHAQVTSNAKLFSGASTAFGAEPNSQVSLVDAAMPGMLPVPNRECIRQAVRTGMAIEAQINQWSRFDRKNYFYADLPQGYQISQLYHPLVGEGSLLIEADEKTAGGILLPDNAKEKPQVGEITAVGPGKRNDDGSRQEPEIKVGDKVLYSKYAGTDIKLGGDEYVLLSEKDILAIVS